MMRIGSMLNDVARSLFKRPFTQPYPFKTYPVAERTRGQLEWDREKCNGCGLCARDCPAQAIEVKTIDRAAHRFIYNYRTDRCIYCGQCVESCKPQALKLSADRWHLASTARKQFSLAYGETPEQAAEAVAKTAAPTAAPAPEAKPGDQGQ